MRGRAEAPGVDTHTELALLRRIAVETEALLATNALGGPCLQQQLRRLVARWRAECPLAPTTSDPPDWSIRRVGPAPRCY